MLATLERLNVLKIRQRVRGHDDPFSALKTWKYSVLKRTPPQAPIFKSVERTSSIPRRYLFSCFREDETYLGHKEMTRGTYGGDKMKTLVLFRIPSA